MAIGRRCLGNGRGTFRRLDTRACTNAKVRENYARRFRIRFPNEELPAARPLRTTNVHERLKAKGAVFGVAFGLEHALWFAPEGTEPVEEVTFRRSNAHAPVAAECRAARDGVGLLEISSYAKYEVERTGCRGVVVAPPRQRSTAPGTHPPHPMLNHDGKLMGIHARAPWTGNVSPLRVRHRRAVPYALVRGAASPNARCAPLFA